MSYKGNDFYNEEENMNLWLEKEGGRPVETNEELMDEKMDKQAEENFMEEENIEEVLQELEELGKENE